MSIEIILADPNKAMRRRLRALLEREPDLAVVAETAGAKTTLNLVRQLSPQILIIDGALLDLQGGDLLRRLISESPGLKVITLASFSDRRLALNLFQAGASAYLLKDSLFDELPRAIRLALANRICLGQGVSDLVLSDYVGVLRESEAQFRTMFERAPFGTALLDQAGRLLQTNAAFQEMLGYRGDELQHMSFFIFAHPEDMAHCRLLFQELMQGKHACFEMEPRFYRQDGRLVWGRLTVTLMPTGEEKPRIALALVEDISAQKRRPYLLLGRGHYF
jgi:PAS domain S-box-containing protein